MKKVLLMGLIALGFSCQQKMEKIAVIGHRGAMGYEPENTLPSIEKALSLGADMIEIDIFPVKGDEVVVFHDDRLDRLTNGTGFIEDHTYYQLTALRVNGKYAIPTLQSVLKTVDHQSRVNIEIKGKRLAARLNFILDYYIRNKGWKAEDFLISSFDHEQLKEFRSLNQEVPVALLTEGDPLELLPLAKELKAEAIHPEYLGLTRARVTEIKDAGFKVNVWTVNDPEDIQHMADMGVDGIISDFPDRVAEIVRHD